MNIEEFYSQYRNASKPMLTIAEKWQKKKVDDDIDALLSAVILTTDGLVGDGLSDCISSELRDAISAVLKKEPVDSYGGARAYLRTFLEKDDKSVQGMISKIKGQIGENSFIEATGGKAQLASSGSQEGWDISINHGDYIQYVQVKTCASPDHIINKMREIIEKINSKEISGVNDEVVKNIDFAVPYDVVERVNDKMENYPELTDVNVLSIDVSASEAAKIVQEGLTNLGPGATAHLFGELLSGTLSAAAMHTLLSSIRVWQGQMAVDEAASQILGNTAVSATGYAAGLTVEVALDKTFNSSLAPVSIGAGIAVRKALKKAAKSRISAYQNLCLNNQILKNRIERFRLI